MLGLRGSESLGPLHGFPHAVKDLQAVRGIPMTMGSPILRNYIPSSDGLMVERLRRAGAIFIGKTNTPEGSDWARILTTAFMARRVTRMTRLARQGATAAARRFLLALRMLPLADSSDYGGSLQQPGWLERRLWISHQHWARS